MPKSSIDVNHDSKYEVVFNETTPPPKDKIRFYYQPIGVYKYGAEQMEALHEISKFSKAELFLLDIVNNTMVRTANYVKITKSNYSVAEQRKLTTAIKAWLDKGLIKRVRREEYMVNPNFFTPPKGKHESFYTAWNILN